TWPQASRMIRQPAFAVAEVPSLVGRLPTMTQPLRSATRAVVRPTPPGQRPATSPFVIVAKVDTAPPGATSTIVVAVPWALAALLKLLTRVLPRWRSPIERGTIATP